MASNRVNLGPGIKHVILGGHLGSGLSSKSNLTSFGPLNNAFLDFNALRSFCAVEDCVLTVVSNECSFVGSLNGFGN